MRRRAICAILGAMLLCSRAHTFQGTGGRVAESDEDVARLIGSNYGHRVAYGEGLHPGLDVSLPIGTPIVAASDGVVIWVAYTDRLPYHGGWFVKVDHGEFDTIYGHLSELKVVWTAPVKWGELIGFSGADNTMTVRRAHLHFGVCKPGGNCQMYSQTMDPAKFWLKGRPLCYDPKADYSHASRSDLTAPIVCGDYARALFKQANQQDR